MFEFRLRLALEFRNNALGQDLSQLDAPLVKGINVPYGSLDEDAMLVERDQFAQGGRRQSVHQNGVGWPITLEHPMWNKPIRFAFCLYLLTRLPELEPLGLG